LTFLINFPKSNSKLSLFGAELWIFLGSLNDMSLTLYKRVSKQTGLLDMLYNMGSFVKITSDAITSLNYIYGYVADRSNKKIQKSVQDA
jgi:hypothetical protein